MSQKETVLSVMRDAAKPLRTGEIAELAGLDRKEVDKAMKELKAEGAIFSPIRCCWQAAN
jgi:CRP-like cAMP-binding protein